MSIRRWAIFTLRGNAVRRLDYRGYPLARANNVARIAPRAFRRSSGAASDSERLLLYAGCDRLEEVHRN